MHHWLVPEPLFQKNENQENKVRTEQDISPAQAHDQEANSTKPEPSDQNPLLVQKLGNFSGKI